LRRFTPCPARATVDGVAYIDDVLARARARRTLPPPRSRRALREAAGLSQEQVAHALGVTRPQVSRYESGQRTPGVDVATRYAALLDRIRQEIA
jgi:DNA-binding XRE family transcriptional regulator